MSAIVSSAEIHALWHDVMGILVATYYVFTLSEYPGWMYTAGSLRVGRQG